LRSSNCICERRRRDKDEKGNCMRNDRCRFPGFYGIGDGGSKEPAAEGEQSACPEECTAQPCARSAEECTANPCPRSAEEQSGRTTEHGDRTGLSYTDRTGAQGPVVRRQDARTDVRWQSWPHHSACGKRFNGNRSYAAAGNRPIQGLRTTEPRSSDTEDQGTASPCTGEMRLRLRL